MTLHAEKMDYFQKQVRMLSHQQIQMKRKHLEDQKLLSQQIMQDQIDLLKKKRLSSDGGRPQTRDKNTAQQEM